MKISEARNDAITYDAAQYQFAQGQVYILQDDDVWDMADEEVPGYIQQRVTEILGSPSENPFLSFVLKYNPSIRTIFYPSDESVDNTPESH